MRPVKWASPASDTSVSDGVSQVRFVSLRSCASPAPETRVPRSNRCALDFISFAMFRDLHLPAVRFSIRADRSSVIDVPRDSIWHDPSTREPVRLSWRKIN